MFYDINNIENFGVCWYLRWYLKWPVFVVIHVQNFGSRVTPLAAVVAASVAPLSLPTAQ